MSKEGMDEKELVSLCIRGDREAWAEFLRRYDPTLRMLARYALRSIRTPEHEIDEIAAKVLEDLVEDDYRALRGFRWQCSLETWLRILVRTACSRLWRRKRLATEEIPLPEPAPGPLEQVLSDERRRAVRSALDDLPERDRAVLTLFFIEGHPYQEISRRMDLPMGTVATVLSRARQKLKEILGRKFPG